MNGRQRALNGRHGPPSVLVRWFGGSVVRWFGGSVVRWFGGSVVARAIVANLNRCARATTGRPGVRGLRLARACHLVVRAIVANLNRCARATAGRPGVRGLTGYCARAQYPCICPHSASRGMHGVPTRYRLHPALARATGWDARVDLVRDGWGCAPLGPTLLYRSPVGVTPTKGPRIACVRGWCGRPGRGHLCPGATPLRNSATRGGLAETATKALERITLVAVERRASAEASKRANARGVRLARLAARLPAPLLLTH